MKRFVEGEDRRQGALLPHCLDDYVTENNPVRVIEAFIDELDLATLGFDGVVPETTGRPAYHPATLLKIYLYGYLNRVQSSRRLEREAQRNIELMWLTGRLVPDFKTIADFRKDNGAAIRAVCSQFVVLCRELGLFIRAVVAIDGSKFKAVNNRDKNYTVAKVIGRIEQVNGSIARYLRALDQADREESDIAEAKSVRLKEKIAGLRRQMRALKVMEQTVQDAPDQQVSLTDPDARSMATSDDAEHDHYTCPAGVKLTKIHRRVDHTEDFDRYRHLSACSTCPLRPRCTPTRRRIIKRWEHEDVLDRMQDQLDRMPEAMGVRRQTVEHPFGTLKAWMGATHFLTRTLDKVRTEISLHVLAYNLKRMITIFGVGPLMAAIRSLSPRSSRTRRSI